MEHLMSTIQAIQRNTQFLKRRIRALNGHQSRLMMFEYDERKDESFRKRQETIKALQNEIEKNDSKIKLIRWTPQNK